MENIITLKDFDSDENSSSNEDQPEKSSVTELIFVVVKISIIMTLMAFGLRDHLRLAQKVNSIMFLYLLFNIIMLLLFYYEFWKPLIIILYVLLVLTSFSQIIGIQIFVNKARRFQSKKAKNWLNFVMAFTHISIFLVMGMGFS